MVIKTEFCQRVAKIPSILSEQCSPNHYTNTLALLSLCELKFECFLVLYSADLLLKLRPQNINWIAGFYFRSVL